MTTTSNTTVPTDRPILLFDGVCNLCASTVQFVIKRDPKVRFRFAPLQSETGKTLLRKHGLATDEISTIVLIEGEKAYTKSTAALRAAKQLTGLWPLLFGFIIVPTGMRNWCYDLIAANRYRWFGEKDACMMPSPEDRARFLESN